MASNGSYHTDEPIYDARGEPDCSTIQELSSDPLMTTYSSFLQPASTAQEDQTHDWFKLQSLIQYRYAYSGLRADFCDDILSELEKQAVRAALTDNIANVRHLFSDPNNLSPSIANMIYKGSRTPDERLKQMVLEVTPPFLRTPMGISRATAPSNVQSYPVKHNYILPSKSKLEDCIDADLTVPNIGGTINQGHSISGRNGGITGDGSVNYEPQTASGNGKTLCDQTKVRSRGIMKQSYSNANCSTAGESSTNCGPQASVRNPKTTRKQNLEARSGGATESQKALPNSYGSSSKNEKKVHSCIHCFKDFLNADRLAVHLIRTHPKGKAFSCGICDKTFTEEVELKTHEKAHLIKPKRLGEE